jgi:hypothetical protein
MHVRPAQERRMTSEEILKCPLCRGEAHVKRSELIALLSDNQLPEKVEKYLAELLDARREAVAVANGAGRDFQKEVHSWNPQLPIWRRSPKE